MGIGNTYLRILFTQVLVEDNSQMTHEFLLFARLHDCRDPRDEVSRLLPHFGSLVVEPEHIGLVLNLAGV